MNESTLAQDGQHLLMHCSDESKRMGLMYSQYPEGYDKGVAEENCRLFADVVPREFPVATAAVARVLVDIGMAKAIAHAYFCARSELGRGHRSRDDMRDAYVSISGLIRNWRRLFSRMDPDSVKNEDVAEIMRLIQLDGDEEGEFEEYENMSD